MRKPGTSPSSARVRRVSTCLAGRCPFLLATSVGRRVVLVRKSRSNPLDGADSSFSDGPSLVIGTRVLFSGSRKNGDHGRITKRTKGERSPTPYQLVGISCKEMGDPRY